MKNYVVTLETRNNRPKKLFLNGCWNDDVALSQSCGHFYKSFVARATCWFSYILKFFSPTHNDHFNAALIFITQYFYVTNLSEIIATHFSQTFSF